MPDRDIPHHTRVVVVISPAVTEDEFPIEREVRVQTFKGFIPRVGGIASVVDRAVDHRVAEEHHAAPVAARVRTPDVHVPGVFRVINVRRENDRVLRRTFGVKLGAAGDVKGADIGALAAEVVTLNDGAGLDVQHRVAHHEHPAVHHVDVRPIPGVRARQYLVRIDGIRLCDTDGHQTRACQRRAEAFSKEFSCHILNLDFFEVQLRRNFGDALLRGKLGKVTTP